MDHVTCGNMIQNKLTATNPVAVSSVGAQNDIISIGTYTLTLPANAAMPTPQPSAGVSIRDYCREGGGITTAAGVFDIGVSSDTSNVRIENCNVPDEGAVPQIILDRSGSGSSSGASGVVIENLESGGVIMPSPPPADLIVIGNGKITIGSTTIAGS
jgi:hypothetical protein